MSTIQKKPTGLQLKRIAQVLAQTAAAGVALAKLLHELTEGQFAVPDRPEMATHVMVQLLERHAAHLESTRHLEGLTDEEIAAKREAEETERLEGIRAGAAAALEAMLPKPAEPVDVPGQEGERPDHGYPGIQEPGSGLPPANEHDDDNEPGGEPNADDPDTDTQDGNEGQPPPLPDPVV